ncbi:MAG TPA: DUF2336 domain-containing protein [Alphaproteobacteria bacterium]|nr:DUF2336 domain-containing protein [Alphaproteobacteria bacterium]HOO50052.1 DUF2336 domain-containing protein [Alphaproteobacteria bacterium]
MGLFSSLFGSNRSKPTDNGSASSFEEEKKIALNGSEAQRRELAVSPSTSREILCYMAVKDRNEDIRFILAERLAKLLPDLSTDKQGKVYKYIVEALSVLALDEVIKIRVALSSVLKDYADAPPDIVKKLARDIERQVSEPILRYCLALPDEDLLDILKTAPKDWAIEAIAERPVISQPVSGAVLDTGNIKAGHRLIENSGADISLDDLKRIVEKAKDYPEWQKPIAMRKNLPKEIMQELTGFVEKSVKTILLDATDYSQEEMDEITTNVVRRVEFADEKREKVQDRVLRYYKEGRLDNEIIQDALSVRDTDFVICSLAALIGTTAQTIREIIQMKSAKAVVALAWKAGLSMRTALRLQQELAQIPHTDIIYPRGGTDYPLTDDDLNWQLDFMNLGQTQK